MADHKLELVFVVNGKPVNFEVNVNQPLGSVLVPVLKKAGIAGDPQPDRWEFNYNGNVLDPSKKIGDFGFPAGAQIFLNMKAGVAG